MKYSQVLHRRWSFLLRISSVFPRIKDFLLPIWSHLLKKSSMENFIFCAVVCNTTLHKLTSWNLLHSIYSNNENIISSVVNYLTLLAQPYLLSFLFSLFVYPIQSRNDHDKNKVICCKGFSLNFPKSIDVSNYFKNFLKIAILK